MRLSHSLAFSFAVLATFLAMLASAGQPKANRVSTVRTALESVYVATPKVEAETIQTTSEIVIVAAPVKATPKVEASKVWTCGAPVALATDAKQTVRTCEYK